MRKLICSTQLSVCLHIRAIHFACTVVLFSLGRESGLSYFCFTNLPLLSNVGGGLLINKYGTRTVSGTLLVV
jgi:hypothetical protein